MTSAASQAAMSPAALRAQAERSSPSTAGRVSGWSRCSKHASAPCLAHAVERSPYYRETLGPDAAETSPLPSYRRCRSRS